MFITHCACPSVLVRDPVCTWPVWHVSTDTRKHGSLGKAWIWKRLLSNQLWPGGETGPGIQTCSCIAHTRAGGGQAVRRESPLILWMSQTVMSNWVELIQRGHWVTQPSISQAPAFPPVCPIAILKALLSQSVSFWSNKCGPAEIKYNYSMAIKGAEAIRQLRVEPSKEDTASSSFVLQRKLWNSLDLGEESFSD